MCIDDFLRKSEPLRMIPSVSAKVEECEMNYISRLDIERFGETPPRLVNWEVL